MMEPLNLQGVGAPVGARRSARTTSLNILVLHQHYWPETAATAQILSDVCEDLAAMGHRVTVLCGQPSYRKGNQTVQPARQVHKEVSIERVWSMSPVSRNIPARLVHYGTYFASSLGAALSRSRPDVCLVMSTPPLLLGVTGTLLRALRGVPFVYSVQDLYPDIAIHLGVLPREGALVTAIEQTARMCYRSASALITLSNAMADRLIAKTIPSDRVHVIPNWADTSAVRPVARDNAFAQQHGLADSFVVQYSGNLGLSQGLESLIEAADLLRSHPVRFAIIGDGNAKPVLERTAASKGLTNICFLPPQPRDRLSEVLSACDVGIVPMKKGVAGDLVPSKLYGIMAAARPVLAAVEPSSEVSRVVHAHGCGWVIAPESPSALANGVLNAMNEATSDRHAKGEAGRAACADLYSRAALTSRYASVLAAAATNGLSSTSFASF